MLRHLSNEPPGVEETEGHPIASSLPAAATGTRLLAARQADQEWRRARVERLRAVRRTVQGVFETILSLGALAGFTAGIILVATALSIWIGPQLGMAAPAQRWTRTAEALAVVFWGVLGFEVGVGLLAAATDAGMRRLGKREGIDLEEPAPPSGDLPVER